MNTALEQIGNKIVDYIEFGHRYEGTRETWYREACGLLTAYAILNPGFPELDACLEARRMIHG